MKTQQTTSLDFAHSALRAVESLLALRASIHEPGRRQADLLDLAAETRDLMGRVDALRREDNEMAADPSPSKIDRPGRRS